jgi:hypothetical protein
MRRPSMSSLSLGVILACGLLLQQAAGTELEKRLREEYPEAAGRLESRLKTIQARGVRTTTVGGKVTETDELFVARKDGYYLYERTRASKVGDKIVDDTMVMCQTPSYWFQLGRSGKDKPYVITTLSEGTYRERVQGERFYIGQFFSPANVRELYLPDLIRTDGFRILSLKEEGGGGRERTIALEFAVKNDRFPIDYARIVLAPEIGWPILSYELTPRAHEGVVMVTFSMSAQYKTLSDGTPVPEKVTHSFVTKDLRTKKEGGSKSDDPPKIDTMTFSQVTLEPLPDERFSLTAYGLPDLTKVQRRPASFFSFLNPAFWVSIMAASGSFLLLWYVRRRRGADA